MKAKFLARLFVVFATVSMLMVSCTKENNGFFTTDPDASSNVQIGYLTDLGLVSDNTRHMLAIFYFQGYDYDMNTGDAVGAGIQVKFNIFTNEDGCIPSGTYTSTSLDAKEPFTFTQGDVLIQYSGPENVPSENHLFSFSVGTLTVLQNRDQYSFSFKLVLDSGNTVEGTSSGKMIYQDAF